MKSVRIRLSRLLDADLTPSTKLVWLMLQMEQQLKHRVSRSPTRIQRRIGVSRPTIRKALERLKQQNNPHVASNHDVVPNLRSLTYMRVWVNPELITDTSLSAMARVIYCLLRGLKQIPRKDRPTSYAAIAKIAQVQARTVRLAVRALSEAGWLAVAQKNQRAPLHFGFPNPKSARSRATVFRAKQRLDKAKYRGETLALLWCDTLVDSTNYQDDYFPSAFTNPKTHELLQADRYYFDHKVAIEFNGPQHDGPTAQFSAHEVKAQMARDRTKQAICNRQKIALVTLHPEDLTFQRMREVLGRVLPLNDISEDEPIIKYLEKQYGPYVRSIERIRGKADPVTG